MLNMASLVSRVTVGPAGSIRAGALAWGPCSGPGELGRGDRGTEIGNVAGAGGPLGGTGILVWLGLNFAWARQAGRGQRRPEGKGEEIGGKTRQDIYMLDERTCL